MNIQARVALDKERHPERFCPTHRCLWRTGDGTACPRHYREATREVWGDIQAEVRRAKGI